MVRQRAPWLIAVLALAVAPLPGSVASAQAELRAADHTLVLEVARALRADDPAALSAHVDFERRFAEEVARGRSLRLWRDFDETGQLLERQLLGRKWAHADAAFQRDASLVALVEITDPDAGHGPVPDRRILQAVLRQQITGEHRDLLVTVTPDSQLLDLVFGPRYFPGANPAGEAGLRPTAELSIEDRPTVAWPDDTPEVEQQDAQQLVDDLLASRIGPDRELVTEQLHRSPRPSVAALIERLDQLDLQSEPDAEAETLIAQALAHITGRKANILPARGLGMDEDRWRATNRESVLVWLRWHRQYGSTFAAVPVEEPIEPTREEQRAGQTPAALERWEAKLRENAAEAAAAAAGAQTPSQSGAGTPPPPPETAGNAGAGANAAPPGSPPAGPANPGADPSGAPLGPTVSLPPGSGATSPRDILFPPAANLTILFGKREVVGRDIESTLTPSLREALNAWAATASRLGLRVVISGNAEQIVLGRAPDGVLTQAAQMLDKTWQLLDPLLPFAPGREPRAIVALVFDEQGTRSPAWAGVLDLLVERRLIFDSAAEPLRTQPAGLMLRSAGLLLQTSFDVAGNAAAGDDEFRLDNELAHKFAQCLVTARLGQLPPTLLWAFGELVEIRFTQAVYTLNVEGFVASGDHFDWPQRAKQMLEKRRKKRDLALSGAALSDSTAGQAVEPQMVIWATLAWLAEKQPATLRDLLLDLSGLHAAADPRGRASVYRGDAARTAEVLQARLDTLDLGQLIGWLDS